jgi:hypothetical protein
VLLLMKDEDPHNEERWGSDDGDEEGFEEQPEE